MVELGHILQKFPKFLAKKIFLVWYMILISISTHSSFAKKTPFVELVGTTFKNQLAH
jgi:hypothetical protein